MDYQEIASWHDLPELKKLLDLSTPPKKLFVQGSYNPEIFAKTTAVVGSRRITDYGIRAIEKIIPILVSQGKTIVSGFMYGVDQYAHQVCLECGGKTIAVLGWGIGHSLSGKDKTLAQKIIDSGGILLSEWQTQEAAHWTFPARNRIVAAISDEIIIVEAAQKSGSLITARLAANLGRSLFAVPGPITSRTSAGTNNLIASGKAKIWIGEANKPVLPIDDPIMETLSSEALNADELSRKLNAPVADIGARLTVLLLAGQVKEIAGKYYPI